MSGFRELIHKLFHLAGRKRLDETLDEEVRLHLESRAAELAAGGMPQKDAMAEARREFGPAARIAEESREAWRWMWLEDLTRDLRYAVRALRRDRGFAIAAVVSLALGIGVNTTIFSLTAEFLFSQPSVRDPGTLVRAWIGGVERVPMAEYRFMRDAGAFEGLAGVVEMQEINWRAADTSVRLFATRVTDNFFDVAGVPIAWGRPIAQGELGVAVISDRFWRSRMGADPGVLGRGLILDARPYTIVGVLPSTHRSLTGFGYVPDVYLPIGTDSISVAFYGRLARGDSHRAALGRLTTAAAELDRAYPMGDRKWADNVSLSALVGIERLRQGFLTTVSSFFALMMGVVGLLLVIACANVASLLLARASTRAQEFAIRMSIGAGRGRLIRQLLAESLLLSLMGTAAGLGLNYVLTRYMNGATLPLPFPVKLSIEPDSRLLIYASAVAIASALLCGLLPALKSTRSGTSALLKRDEHQVSGRRATLRNVLVGGQLAVSVLILIMAALAIRNLVRAATLDPGFDLRQTVWAQMKPVPENNPNPEQGRSKVAATIDRLGALTGVEAASFAALVPLNDHFASRTIVIYTDAAEQGSRVSLSWNIVGPGYLNTMGIGLAAGREFTAADREGAQRTVILNESIARQIFPGVNPLGRRVRFGREDRTERVVVGVARNSKYSTLGERDRPAVYEPYLQIGSGRGMLNFMVKTTGPPEASLKAINAALLEMDPSAAVEARPMNRALGFALLPSRAGAGLLGAIGSLGLILASVGLYGVLAYSISRRTREIGLRVALGAQRSQVLRLVMREGITILVISLAVGAFVALFVTRPFARFLVPGLSTSDPVTYITVAAVLMAVGCAASLMPALRAMRIDPLAALRDE